VEWYWEHKAEVLVGNLVTLPHYKPQIPQGLVLDRTRAVICRKLTAWSMERSLTREINVNCTRTLSSYLKENTLLPLGRQRLMLLREINFLLLWPSEGTHSVIVSVNYCLRSVKLLVLCVSIVFTDWLIYSMVQSPSWAANWFAAKTKLRGLNPHANYTDRAAAAGRRS